LVTNVFAASSTNYVSSPEAITSSGGSAESSSYNLKSSLAANITGVTSSSSYSVQLGFIAASVTTTTTTTAATTTTTTTTTTLIPTISTLYFDGRTIEAGDTVNNAVTIITTLSAAAGINISTSSVEVDSISTFLAALTGDSTYETGSGTLTYKSAAVFVDGSHTFKVVAVDNSSNSTEESISFSVNTSTGITGAVLTYPNPFNPNTQPTQITYQLNQDADVQIFLFNSLGQLAWKQHYVSGSEGGHAGYNSVNWNGISNFGGIVPNGLYFCRIVVNGQVVGKGKIAVLK